MKIEFGLVALACVLAVTNMQRDARAEMHPDLPKLGVYDPRGTLGDKPDVGIEHIFLNWNQFSAEAFRATAAEANARGRELLVTVEPWTRAPNGTDGGENLLASVNSGEFDTEIAAICGEIGETGSPVMVNWGHEMDETEGRFPWANRPAETYRQAHRHFVDQCRARAPNARFVWTPKGEPTLATYYPGDASVDFIGLTLFDLQAWNRDHDDRRTLTEKFEALHGQVVGFGKPIVLVEFGVSGDAAYRARSLACAQEQFAQFQGVEAIVYFNEREPWAWPGAYGRPDWSISDTELFACESKQS